MASAPRGFDEAATGLLRAIIGRINPADAEPGALELGTDHYVFGQLQGALQALVPDVEAGLTALRANCPVPFEQLDEQAQDDTLGTVAGEAWFRALAELVAEGFYANPGNGGNREARSWAMIGYEHRLPDGPDGGPRTPPSPPQGGAAEAEEWDVVVVGAGAAGGIMAAVLAEAGKRVLLLERGPHLTYSEGGGYRDHLRNQRLSQHGHNAGPEEIGNPRVLVDPDGHERIIAPHQPGYHNNAAAVGSGTVVYGAQAWRFLPDDFRMASRYGVPDGSSMVDWPIGYDDLAPYYSRAEWEIGVAGHTTPELPIDYPMPPAAQSRIAQHLAAGAEKIGFETLSPPLLINTIDRDGRPACIQCASCIGFACPSNSKNGTHNTAIPRALRTGNCELVDCAMVERVDTDVDGRVTGVTYRTDADGGQSHTVRAKAVVLSAGAIETARLLLMSRSERHPAGLGNARDQVGRHLQGHYYVSAWGQFDEDIHDPRGPGVTIATRQFNHGNDNIIGGAMLADDFVLLPAIFWKLARRPGSPFWGQGAKDYMRHWYRRTMSIKGPVHEIPVADCRVQLSDTVQDRYGLPVVRLSGLAHSETVRTTEFMSERAIEWLRAAGAKTVWSDPVTARLSGGQHQAGTCRMGTDPEKSVTDIWGRVWDHDNLFVSDGSLHPTNGGFNPVLTIMALAFRNAEHIASTI